MDSPRQSSPPPAPVPAREQGAALILTIIVLTILIVLVVQFAFSVNRESIIVRNTQDDAALELAARGVVPWLRALCQEDRANGAPAGDIDTLGDILFDPQAERARSLKVGQVELTFVAEDAERRFPLPWLASGEEKKAEWAKVVLKRLITKLEIEGDAEALAESIATKVQSLAESAKQGPIGGQPAPQPGAAPGSDAAQLRWLFSVEELLDEAPKTDPAADPAAGGQPDPAATPAAAKGGVDRVVLFGIPADEEKGIEGKKGLAAYVTTWDTAGININTALPEVLFAILPEKDKLQPEDQATDLWAIADELVEAIRTHRIDPELGGGAAADPAAPAPAPAPGASPAPGAGGMGASRKYSGKAFEKPEELESTEIHEKLGAIFTAKKKDSGGQQGDATATPNPGDGGAATPAEGDKGAQAGDGSFGLKQALVVKSRLYLVRVEAQLSPDVKNAYRLVVARNDKDDVRALWIEEVTQ